MARIQRQDVPVEETWRLEDIFGTEAAWEQAYLAVQQELPDLAEHGRTLSRSAAALLAALEARDGLLERLNRVLYYANCRQTEDATDPANQVRAGRAQGLYGEARAVLTALQTALTALPAEVVAEYRAAEPRLDEFSTLLEDLAEIRAHSLAPAAEAALAALDRVHSAPYLTYHTVTSADMRFEPVRDGQGREVAVSLFSFLTNIETSPDTVLRRRAYESLTRALTAHQHGVAVSLSTEIAKQVALARLRGYRSTAAMLLNYPGDGARVDRVGPETFAMVLDIFLKELAPHMRRYARLRQRVLGLDRLLICDVKAPLDPGFDPRISFAAAGAMITAGVGALGEEYQQTMGRAFTERWVYRADNAGRGMIAFGGGAYGVHGYSFYPWGGTVFDAFLLGHELGHSVHYDFAMRHQRITNFTPPRLFVEHPSTMVEHLMVRQQRAATTDPRYQRWLTMYLLMSCHHNFVTHILEGELLRRLYRMAEAGRPLTTGAISGTKRAVLSDFWGDTVTLDEGAELAWMRQPHYYMGLYPYTYSVGLSASMVLAERVISGGTAAGEAWVAVLKQGGRRSAMELFRQAGIDMSRPEPYQAAVAQVGLLVDELERAFA